MTTRMTLAKPRPIRKSHVPRTPDDPALSGIFPSRGTGFASTRPPSSSMQSVGHQLMKARKALNLSIEDVAFETRIPHQRLRDMENDDLSNFANLTYAKGFLKLYSRHLKLDLHDYLDEFDTSVIAEAAGHEWSRTANIVGTLSPPSIAPDQPRNPASYLIMAATALVVGGIVWMFLKPHARPQSANPNPTAQSPPAAVVVKTPGENQGQSPSDSLPPSPPENRTRENASTGTLARAATPASSLPVVESFPPPAAPPASPNPPPSVLPPPEPGASVRRATIVDDQGNEVPR